MPHFAYNVGGWVQKLGKMCLRNKSMAPKGHSKTTSLGHDLTQILDHLPLSHGF